jgi:acyl carrier protein
VDNIRGSLRRFIVDSIVGDEDSVGLTDSADLRATGVLDSLSILKVVAFIEQTFDIELESEEVERFSSVEKIVSTIEAKLKARSALSA